MPPYKHPSDSRGLILLHVIAITRKTIADNQKRTEELLEEIDLLLKQAQQMG